MLMSDFDVNKFEKKNQNFFEIVKNKTSFVMTKKSDIKSKTKIQICFINKITAQSSKK